MTRLAIAGPSISSREIDYVSEAVRGAWYEDAGEFLTRFEQAFAARVGRRFALALPSCTSGLHLALAALGIGPGDEVVVPELTWIASAAPIHYVGAKVVFADVDPQTWCLDVNALEAVITPRTRAVIAVDLYGNLPDMAALQRLCDVRGIALIEDAAQAIGSTRGGQPAGSFGAASVFSFHGSKTLTTGEGGMLVTDDAQLHARICVLRDHGRAPGDRAFFNAEIGFKYKMSPILAALGLAQLERLDELVAAKRALLERYAAGLAGIDALSLNDPGPEVDACPWMVTAVSDPSLELSKASFAAGLAASEIDSRPMFHPLSSLPAYASAADRERARATNRVAYSIAPRGINLPSALRMTMADVDRVCARVRAIVSEAC